MKNTCKAVGSALLPTDQTTDIIHDKKKKKKLVLFSSPALSLLLYSYNNQAMQNTNTHTHTHTVHGAARVTLREPNHMHASPIAFDFLFFFPLDRNADPSYNHTQLMTHLYIGALEHENFGRSNCCFVFFCFSPDDDEIRRLRMLLLEMTGVSILEVCTHWPEEQLEWVSC